MLREGTDITLSGALTQPHHPELINSELKTKVSVKEARITPFRVRLTNNCQVKTKVSVKGLEPLTNGLKGHCSTIELHAQRG